MVRDLMRDRHNLRERTITMIEGLVEESRLKLLADIQQSNNNMKKSDLQGKLAE